MDKYFKIAANHMNKKQDSCCYDYANTVVVSDSVEDNLFYSNGYIVCTVKNPNNIAKEIYNKKGEVCKLKDTTEYPAISAIHNKRIFKSFSESENENVSWNHIIDKVFEKSLPIVNLKETLEFLKFEVENESFDRTIVIKDRLIAFNNSSRCLEGVYAFKDDVKISESDKDKKVNDMENICIVDTQYLYRVIKAYEKERDVRMSYFWSGKLKCIIVSTEKGFSYILSVNYDVKHIIGHIETSRNKSK